MHAYSPEMLRYASKFYAAAIDAYILYKTHLRPRISTPHAPLRSDNSAHRLERLHAIHAVSGCHHMRGTCRTWHTECVTWDVARYVSRSRSGLCTVDQSRDVQALVGRRDGACSRQMARGLFDVNRPPSKQGETKPTLETTTVQATSQNICCYGHEERRRHANRTQR